MSQLEADQDSDIKVADSSWRGIYVVGGISTLLALAGTLTDITITMIPGWDVSTVPASIQAWFTQLQINPLLGLRNLDLLNIAISVIQIPMFLALYGVHRRVIQAYAALALVVVLTGTIVFISSNAALPMLDLSMQYSRASTGTQQSALEAAGLALLVRGAHGSMGAFLGFFLSSIGTLLFALVMLAGKVFTRLTAWSGIVGITLLIIYMIGVTFVPKSETAMIIIAMPGGVLMMAWNVMVARKLFQLRVAHDE